jgi:hypothetical protein
MEMNGSTKQPSGEQNPLWKRLSTAPMTVVVRIREKLAQLASLRALLAVAIGLLLLHLFGLISLPFPPFTTTGRIYVDSPEVYTRERLVNDRYDQDFWLRQQLEKLDDPDVPLVAEEISTSIKGGNRADDTSGSDKTAHNKRLTFEQKFRVVGGIRDMIRQQLLENMLDDRHDLTGNSVYGLKFDTTVIPGSNTHQRAFVHVVLEIDDLFNAQNAQNDTRPHIDPVDGYILSEFSSDFIRKVNRDYQKQGEYYQTWLTDIAKRLNRMEDSVFENMWNECALENGQDFYDKLTRRTLEIALGIPQERFSRLNEKSVATSSRDNAESGAPSEEYIILPDPWASFFRIVRTPFNFHGDHSCKRRVWFRVDEMSEQLIALKKYRPETDQETTVTTNSDQGEAPQHSEEQSPDQSADQQSDNDDSCPMMLLGDSEGSEWTLYVDCWERIVRDKTFDKHMTNPTRFPLFSETIEKLLKGNADRCNQDGDDVTGSGLNDRRDLDLCKFELRSGFFNFVNHLSALDAYSYAIFPKNDVVGIFAETSAQLSASATGAGFLDVAKHRNESTTASVLVGYGDGKGGAPQNGNERSEHKGSIAFGWVISARGNMQPTQKSQLALVSVPAWTDKLHLTAYVGWLDRHGNPVWKDEDKVSLSISVPPDFEAFDSIFREDAWVTRGPRIQDEEMEKSIHAKVGETTKILIPGTRLWRSASVTLGAQLADRIRVLPNMEGIIAEFVEVELPYASSHGEIDTSTGDSQGNGHLEKCDEQHVELESRPVRLRVWTSEGMTKADRMVCVYYDPVTVGVK